MAPHTLLIERAESPGPRPVTGGRVAYTRIKTLITRGWALSRAELPSEIGCPPEAVRFSRVGPIYLAHGREWARGRELDSLCWRLLYPAILHIRGRALAVRPDHSSTGPGLWCWRALREPEASNAQRVLRAFAEPLTPCASDRWEGLRIRIHGEWARRLYLAPPSKQEAALIGVAEHESTEQRLRQVRTEAVAVAA